MFHYYYYLFMTIIISIKIVIVLFLIIINDLPNSSHSTFSPLSLDAKRP